MSSNRSGVVEVDEFAVSLCYIFVSFGSNVDIVVHYDNNPFWISADTNKDDLECPIHLKVRFVDGTLDVRMLWLIELTMRDRMNTGLKCQRQKCGQ